MINSLTGSETQKQSLYYGTVKKRSLILKPYSSLFLILVSLKIS